jgi:3'-phosphoadenosine 5'-phosphosulfate sulfotransferase (PAPS reductase)/FAD synthetase
LKNYAKKNNRKPIMATMEHESNQRAMSLKGSCNVFDELKGHSNPMKFWTNENVWEYIEKNNIELSEAYTKHGYKRTGCYGCLYGCYKGADENRMVRLEETHPLLHKFLGDKMGYKGICEELGVEFSKNINNNLEEENN